MEKAIAMDAQRRKHQLRLWAAVCLAAILSLFLFWGSEKPVHAAGGLDLSTDYPGIIVKPGESLDIAIYVNNSTGSGQDVDLSIASLPEGWEGYLQGGSYEVSRVYARTGEAGAQVTLHLTIPGELEEGTYEAKVNASAGEGISDSLTLTFSVNEVNAGQVTFTPSGESATVAGIEVDPSVSQGLTVAVVPPEGVAAGEYEISCSAVSAEETLTTDLKVVITGTYGISLGTPGGRLSFDAHANQNSDLTLNITNTGNVDLQNVSLNSSLPSGWTVTYNDLEENVIESIPAGSTVQVIAHVKPGSDAITGDYVATFTAQTEETSAAAEFRVSVKTGTLWGAVAILIILAVAAGLGYVFHKYGRR